MTLASSILRDLSLDARRIITSFVHPPIPIRSHDWCAWVDGTDETGVCGWGRMEHEAIQDLKELLWNETQENL